MEETMSNAAMAVLSYHRDHPEEFGHAGHLIGGYKEIQTLEDLDRIYQMLEEQGKVQASASDCAVYRDKTGQEFIRTKFRYKAP